MHGAAGNDRLSGGAGNDALDGGPGNDQAAFFDAPGPVSLNLGNGKANGWAADKLLGIEDAFGSAYDDTLTRDGGRNDLWGFEGDDTLSGGPGGDSLDGGSGSDRCSDAAPTGNCETGSPHPRAG